MKDLYKVLGLLPQAEPEVIKASYKALAQKYHPDKHKPEQTGLTQREAIEKFQLINNAYSYLVERM